MSPVACTRVAAFVSLGLLAGCAGAPATPGPAAVRCPEPPPLPADHATTVRARLDAARPHAQHLWRDTAPLAGELVVGVVEIPRGSRDKLEFDMAAGELRLDRVIDPSVGGYPVNYGFIPQTIAHDGDPLDILVLGEPRPAGSVLRGQILGVMHMDDEGGHDSKVVVHVPASEGGGAEPLDAAEQERIGAFFAAYKKPDAALGKWSRVTGWGEPCEALEWIALTRVEARNQPLTRVDARR